MPPAPIKGMPAFSCYLGVKEFYFPFFWVTFSGTPDGTLLLSLDGSMGSLHLQLALRDCQGEPLIPGPETSEQGPLLKGKGIPLKRKKREKKKGDPEAGYLSVGCGSESLAGLASKGS